MEARPNAGYAKEKKSPKVSHPDGVLHAAANGHGAYDLSLTGRVIALCCESLICH